MAKLTEEEISIIKREIELDNSLIITQSCWQRLLQLLPQLKNEQTFARRATLSNVDFKIGYTWDEYRWGIDSTKKPLQIRCERCQVIYITFARSMRLRKHRVQVCPKCYVKYYQRDEAWRVNMVAKQKIAQHRPETLAKHRENSKAMWANNRERLLESHRKMVTSQAYRDNMSRVMRDKWATDSEYRDKVIGKGFYKHVGNFESIRYDSKLELAFLIKHFEENTTIKVARFELENGPIQYYDPECNRIRDYYPDFIIDSNLVVEIKGQHWIDVAPLTYAAKIAALSEFCKQKSLQFIVLLADDLKNYLKKAEIQHETCKEDCCSLQGQSS